MKKKMVSTNYDYFVKTDTSAYKGEWIAIAKNKIVAHGEDAEKVYKKAIKKAKKEDVSLAKIPEKQMLILKSLQHSVLQYENPTQPVDKDKWEMLNIL